MFVIAATLQNSLNHCQHNLKKKENAYNRQHQAQQEEHSMNETVELCVSVDSADNMDTGNTDDDFLPFRRNQSEEPSTSMPKHRKRARKSIISPELAATMDRTKLSDRKITFMLAVTARSLEMMLTITQSTDHQSAVNAISFVRIFHSS